MIVVIFICSIGLVDHIINLFALVVASLDVANRRQSLSLCEFSFRNFSNESSVLVLLEGRGGMVRQPKLPRKLCHCLPSRQQPMRHGSSQATLA